MTYRWKGHSKSDKNLYRTKEEIAEWRGKDPILRFEATDPRAGPALRGRHPRDPHPGAGGHEGGGPRGQRRPRRRPVRPARRRLRVGLTPRGHDDDRPGPARPSPTPRRSAKPSARPWRPTTASSCSARTSGSTAAPSASAATSTTASGRSGSGTPRSPSSASSAPPSAPPSPACARSWRSSSPTSPTRRWTRSSTRPPRSTSCSAARPRCRWCCARRSGSGTGAAAQHSQSLEAWFAHVPGPQGRHAGDGRGRQGPAALGDRRPEPGHRARAQAALPHVRPGAGGSRPGPAREVRRTPPRRRPDHRRDRRDGLAGARGGRDPATERASTSPSSTRGPCRRSTTPRSSRTSRAPAARCSSRRRPATPASPPRSPRGSPSRRRSTGCSRRSSGSAA